MEDVSSKRLYSLYIFIVFQEVASCYEWMQYNDKFDCVVGIMVYSTPVSIGTFISYGKVITSANPLQKYWRTHAKNIYVYQLLKTYNGQEYQSPFYIAGNQSYRNIDWVTIGYNDSTHSTIHDIMILFTRGPRDRRFSTPPRFITTYDRRRPFPVLLPWSDTYPKPRGGWYTAGFGYIDDEHVKNNTILEITYLDESTRTDCDEWIPREWGHFICFYDWDNLAGIASGAPLFHESDLYASKPYESMVLYGIGSFSLRKANETILVFTNFMPYAGKLYGVNFYSYYEYWKRYNLPWWDDEFNKI